ncbi:hypothetical protein Hanom_Chr07g00680881 [Helianthus anomalus]
MSKVPFWSLRFGHFCHFSSNLKPFASGSMWFHFCCHFGPKAKSAQISKKNLVFFVLFLNLVRGILVICPHAQPYKTFSLTHHTS